MGLKQQLGAILLLFNFGLVSCAQGESFVLLERRSPMPLPFPLELQALDNGPAPKTPNVFVVSEDSNRQGQPEQSSAQVFYASLLSPVPASKRSLNARAGTCPSGFHACDASIAKGCCENNKYCMVATDGTPGCCLIGKTCTSVSGCPNGFVKCPNTEGCCKIGTTCSGNTCISGNSGGTGTCSPGYFACPQSQGGGCCKTGYTCVGSDKCQPPTTSTSSCDTGKFECPASVGGGCCPIGTTCTADKCIKPCPSGYFRCSANLGGGCCKDGYTCNSDETCSPSNGGNNGGNNGGVCSAGMYACAESEGGGCCSTGYVCTLDKCSKTASGGASAFTSGPGSDFTTSIPVLTRTSTAVRYPSVTSTATSKKTSKTTPTATPTDIPGNSTGGSGRNAVNYGPLVLFFAVAGVLL